MEEGNTVINEETDISETGKKIPIRLTLKIKKNADVAPWFLRFQACLPRVLKVSLQIITRSQGSDPKNYLPLLGKWQNIKICTFGGSPTVPKEAK